MIISTINQSQIKIGAATYEVITSDKNRQLLKQALNRFPKTKQITLDIQNIPTQEFYSEFIKRVLKDQLTSLNRFDGIVDLHVKDILSFHYDGTLISYSSSQLKQRLDNEQMQQRQALEDHIIYLDYIVYNQFYINVSFRIQNDISPLYDNKQILDSLFSQLSHMIDFNLENVLSIENILLTQIKIKIEGKYKIDCCFGNVKFYCFQQDEGSFSYCIIGLMKIFSAREIDLYIDEDCMHELLEHLLHEDNQLKVKQIKKMKIQGYCKQNEKVNNVQMYFDGDLVKIVYTSDSMQMHSYTLQNIFNSFTHSEIQIVFNDFTTINCLKEIKRILKYAILHCHSNFSITCQNQDFQIKNYSSLNKNYKAYTYNLSLIANNFTIKQVSQKTYVVSQYPKKDTDKIGQEIGDSINKYLIKIFNYLRVSVYRYSYYIETPIAQLEQAIKQREENIINMKLNNKCFHYVLDIRINNLIINKKYINTASHSLLAFLKQLKIQNQQKILRKEIIQEMFMQFLKHS